MFFMAESPNVAAMDTSSTPAELTCYRRNLFQVSGSITLPRTLRYIMTDEGNRIPIIAQELAITANESVEGSPIKLISVPWKTPVSNAAAVVEDKGEKEPAPIPLDIMSNQDMDSDFATFPVAWKRLQFRVATANNGRRKELQQHFVVKLRVMATLATGGKVSIAEVHSGAIIVRGRSPRNFQQRKDFPVGNASTSSRKGMHPPALSRNATSESVPQTATKSEAGPQNGMTSFALEQQNGQKFNNARAPSLKHQQSSSASSEKTPKLRLSSSASMSPPGGQQYYPLTPNHDDDPRSVTPRAHKVSRTASHSNPTHFISSVSSLNPDAADLLYEYFPLGLDDWQPPIDGVYRPHVVHHMKMPEATFGKGKGSFARSKRYFSEDQS